MSDPNLRVCYKFSFNATDNVVQGCAICGPQSEILFLAEGIFPQETKTFLVFNILLHNSFIERHDGVVVRESAS